MAATGGSGVGVVLTIRFMVAFVLLAAGAPKAAAPRRIREIVRAYAVLPSWAVGPVARVLPWVELGSAFALIAGWLVLAVAILDAAMFTAFALAVGLNLLRRRRVECGCFGSAAGRMADWSVVATDLVLAAMTVVVATAAWARPSLVASRPTVPVQDALAYGAVAGAAVLTYLVVQAWVPIRGGRRRLAVRSNEASG